MFTDLVWCIIYDHVVTETALCLMCLNMILAIHQLSVINNNNNNKNIIVTFHQIWSDEEAEWRSTPDPKQKT